MSLINIASHLPLTVRLFEPHPDPEKPGNSPALRSIVVPGKRHLGGSPMVVRDVDEDAFNAWKGANAQHSWLKDGLISVISNEDADKLADYKELFGWEPGLENLDTAAAEAGSMQSDVPHTMVDMKAFSDAPFDDSPRSQTPVPGPVVPSPQPVDPEAPEFGSRYRAAPAAPAEADHEEVEREKLEKHDPEPTDHHDETYQQNFKDHAGQEGGEAPVIRGMSKEVYDEPEALQEGGRLPAPKAADEPKK